VAHKRLWCGVSAVYEIEEPLVIQTRCVLEQAVDSERCGC
jgi:hypothetical protein